VYAIPIESDGSLLGSLGVRPSPDGRFTLTNVFQPSVLKTDLDPDTGWIVETITRGGVDITRSGFTPDADAPAPPLEVAVTDATAELKAHVTADDGTPLVGTTVVLTSADEGRWDDPLERFWRERKTDGEGFVTFRGILPGDYVLVAPCRQGAWLGDEPTTVPALRTHGPAAAVTLEHFSSKIVTLRANATTTCA
jgi:hypothetical protein